MAQKIESNIKRLKPQLDDEFMEVFKVAELEEEKTDSTNNINKSYTHLNTHFAVSLIFSANLIMKKEMLQFKTGLIL